MQRSRFVAIAATAALILGAGAVSAQSPSAAPSAPLAGVPTVPTGYAELDQALGPDKPFAGKTVTMQTQWITDEGNNFAASMANFMAATGIKLSIAQVPSGQHETLVNVSLNGGQAANLIALAQPSAVTAYGDKGLLVDVATIMDKDKLAAEHETTLPFYTSGDKIWGIPYDVTVKSVVWYPIKAFAAAGYEVPTTWDELLALSDKMVADGNTPWCIGMESGPATGWIATDWIEDIMLRTAGIDAYRKWITNDLKFDSPEVKNAFDLAGKVFFNPDYVSGGSQAILAINQNDAMDPMFDGDLQTPGCWMQKQALWYGPSEFPDVKAGGPGTVSKYVVGEDVGVFYFPTIDEAQGTPALGAGDAFMVTKDLPEVRAVAQFLSLPEADQAWIQAGSSISANTTTPADWYNGAYKIQIAADILSKATAFGFDASDLMPASGKPFWDGVTQWISDDGANTEDVLKSIDTNFKQ